MTTCSSPRTWPTWSATIRPPSTCAAARTTGSSTASPCTSGRYGTKGATCGTALRRRVAPPGALAGLERVNPENAQAKTSAQPGSPDVKGEQIVLGLAADYHPCRAVADGDHGRPRHVDVLTCHAPAVGAGARDGEQVARRHVGRQELILDDDVAALAVLAHHPGQHPRGRPRARCEGAGEVRVVER